jgi:hypothetical protein
VGVAEAAHGPVAEGGRASTASVNGLADAVQQQEHEAAIASGDRAHGFAGDHRVGVGEQMPQLLGKHVGQVPDHASRLGSDAGGIGAGVRDHLLQQHPRRLQVLGGAGMSQVGHEGRPNRGVGEVTELLDPRQGIHVGVAGEIEQRLGAHAELRVPKQALDASADRGVPGGVEDGDRLPADLGRRVIEQAADRGMGRLLPARLEHAQRIEDLLRVRDPQTVGQDVSGRAVEDVGGPALGVHPVLLDGSAERLHVLAPGHDRGTISRG